MEKTKVKDWFWFFAKKFYLLSVIIGFVTRIILILLPYVLPDSISADFAIHDFRIGQISLLEWLKVLVLGPLNDVAFASIALLPAFIVYSLTTSAKYRKPFGYILEAVLLASTGYFLFCNDITDEYAGPLPRIVNAVMVFFTLCFTLKLIFPRIRDGWRRTVVYGSILLYVTLLLINVLSESVFWLEFGNRYDFVAVDYLVYTNEVIGNIMESYPIIPMFLAIFAVAALVSWLVFFRKHDLRDAAVSIGVGRWCLYLSILLVAAFLGGCW
ncbi:MAG: hypothetical protein IK076_06310, partial [Bacteroidales bacterium]|nr:hypothetical protein [Bacteroidales bacterium]